MNPEGLICNHNLFDLSAPNLDKEKRIILCAILNSTMIGLFKAFYGRYAGTETTLKTEVIDVGLMEIPDPRLADKEIAKKIISAFICMQKRQTTHFLEDGLLNCHSSVRAIKIAIGPIEYAQELTHPDRITLDEAVFQLLGVVNHKELKNLVSKLHTETAKYFREGRVVELQATENRVKSDKRSLSIEDLAADIWDAAELEDTIPLRDWVANQPESNAEISIPEERPAYFPDNPLFELNTVYFGKAGGVRVEYRSREQAELISLLANLGLSGPVRVPAEKDACRKVLNLLNIRLKKARMRFQELAESRTSDDRLRSQLIEILERWFILGREQGKS